MRTGWIEGVGQDARCAGSTMWLIPRGTDPLLDALLVDGNARAVFGHEQEAEMFVWFRGTGTGGGPGRSARGSSPCSSGVRTGRSCVV